MITTPKELTEQAFELYRRLQDKRKPGVSADHSKKLAHGINTALKRYDRRLKKWWATK